ncbi:MAG: hypothetical protein C0500_15270, partial [Sphingobium sp.]|nr:hypothetical protein [Sphingobium sp.]
MAKGQGSYTFRLGTTGKAEVKNDFREIGEAGERVYESLARKVARESAAIEASQKRIADANAKMAA